MICIHFGDADPGPTTTGVCLREERERERLDRKQLFAIINLPKDKSRLDFRVAQEKQVAD
jgi:hypothetical protein